MFPLLHSQHLESEKNLLLYCLQKVEFNLPSLEGYVIVCSCFVQQEALQTFWPGVEERVQLHLVVSVLPVGIETKYIYRNIYA